MIDAQWMWASNVVDSRQHAVELVRAGATVTGAAELVGVSRQCLHKWLRRYRREGRAGLEDRSRAVKNHRDAVSSEMEKHILRARRRYKEGPRKIRWYLQQELVGQRVPAVSTIALILDRHDLVERRPHRRVAQRQRCGPLSVAQTPNDVWCVDYKGEFDVGRVRCYPLTMTDAFSRFALTIRGHRGTGFADAKRTFWRTFRTFGLPRVIRCDNGNPFVSVRAPAGLTRLAVVWARLGIQVERIEPGKPQQNGAHERFHSTLARATARPPARTWDAQQKRFDRFRSHYNTRRPHESLGMLPPARHYEPSTRPCPSRLPAIEHADAELVLNVYRDGGVSHRGVNFFLGSALAQDTVGLREIETDVYTLSYGPIYLGFLDFKPPEPRIHLVR